MQKYPIIGIRKGKAFFSYLKTILFVTIAISVLVYFDILPVAKLLDIWVLTYIFIIVGLPLIFLLLMYLDTKPMIIIDKTALSIRRTRIPFSSLEKIDWNDVDTYRAEVIHSKYSEIYLLTITRKSIRKKYRVDLYDLDSGEEILNAVKYNLNDYKSKAQLDQFCPLPK